MLCIHPSPSSQDSLDQGLDIPNLFQSTVPRSSLVTEARQQFVNVWAAGTGKILANTLAMASHQHLQTPTKQRYLETGLHGALQAASLPATALSC